MKEVLIKMRFALFLYKIYLDSFLLKINQICPESKIELQNLFDGDYGNLWGKNLHLFYTSVFVFDET